jgi:CHASE3 domain sensor protein
MHIPLYQALKAIKISDDQAAQVVRSFEDYMAMKIEDANRALVAQLKAQNWLIGFIGSILAIVGLAPVIAKLF